MQRAWPLGTVKKAIAALAYLMIGGQGRPQPLLRGKAIEWEERHRGGTKRDIIVSLPQPRRKDLKQTISIAMSEEERMIG